MAHEIKHRLLLSMHYSWSVMLGSVEVGANGEDGMVLNYGYQWNHRCAQGSCSCAIYYFFHYGSMVHTIYTESSFVMESGAKSKKSHIRWSVVGCMGCWNRLVKWKHCVFIQTMLTGHTLYLLFRQLFLLVFCHWQAYRRDKRLNNVIFCCSILRGLLQQTGNCFTPDATYTESDKTFKFTPKACMHSHKP